MQSIEIRQIESLHRAFDFYNSALFESKLNRPIFLLDYSVKHAMGFYDHNRVIDNANRSQLCVIGVNPDYFFYEITLLQTIVHEMCHLWELQFHYDQEKSFTNKHTKRWADKMESIGLMPSSTGKPGGKRTGGKMSDYIIEGGLFQTATRGNIDKITLHMIGLPALIEKKKSKIFKYSCPNCGYTVRGKDNLFLLCGFCQEPLVEG